MTGQKAIIPTEQIEQKILLIRGQKVLLDADLAMLYGVPTRVLNQAVRRNLKRFPQDFMFKLSQPEKDKVITICDHLKNLKYAKALPNAFTEHGAIMAASVLNTEKAIQISVFVVRAFVKLREMLATHKELAHKLVQLERKLQNHDESIRSLVVAIRQLMTPAEPKPAPPKRGIGFLVEEPHVPYEVSKGFKKQKKQ
ncbi:MAG: ORF6N domain-containing protein [Deltaproteobacteria bacterium]|nr:ORF6N domain-containing protein [Deltaproteobacteria bacterium]